MTDTSFVIQARMYADFDVSYMVMSSTALLAAGGPPLASAVERNGKLLPKQAGTGHNYMQVGISPAKEVQ